jgi:hypothetical protein
MTATDLTSKPKFPERGSEGRHAWIADVAAIVGLATPIRRHALPEARKNP